MSAKKQPPPRRLGESNLAAAFGGLAPKTPPPAPPVIPSEAPAAATDAPAPQTPAPTAAGEGAPSLPKATKAVPAAPASTSRKKPTAGAPAPAGAGEGDLTVRRTVFVPRSLFDQVSLRCATDRVNRTTLVLQALNHNHARLSDLVAADRDQPTTGGLFALPTTVAEPNHHQLALYPTQAQIDTIDALVAACGADDRSHMVRVSLRDYLDA